MNAAQATALQHPCLLAEECAHPRFGQVTAIGTVVLTVNRGYEGLQLGFGGPVWHASARGATAAVSEALAMRALHGVGDPSLGEWVETGGGLVAVHVRRRLSAEEQAIAGEVEDIRGTELERRRLAQLVADAPHLAGLVGAA